jgi:hypothetical protein
VAKEVVRVRVWLADRPGALGSVASRIGGVGGDVIGIEILERGAGRAIDDLIIALPDPSVIDLLVAEIQQVDGVDVEEVVTVTPDSVDPDIAALESVADLVALESRDEIIQGLCVIVAGGVDASWGAIVDVSDASRERERSAAIVGRVGSPPSNEWLAAFAHGSQSSAMVSAGRSGPDDTVAAPLVRSELVLLVGREGHAFRSRERRRCAAIARIVDLRLGEW